MNECFPAALQAAIQTAAGLNDDGLQVVLQHYVDQRESIGAPPPTDLTLDDAHAVSQITDFRADSDIDWDTFRRRINVRTRNERDLFHPYQPFWFAKTDDRPNTWMRHTGKLTNNGQLHINNVIRDQAPLLNQRFVDLFNTRPILDDVYFADVLDSMVNCLDIFVYDCGGEDESFRWGPSLCMFAGLGLVALQYLAGHLSEQGFEGWDYFASTTHQDLCQEITEARQTHGYPCGLLRVDYTRLMGGIRGESPMDPESQQIVCPRWLSAVTAMHIIKHTRFYPDYEGQACLFAAYKGRQALIPVAKNHWDSPLYFNKMSCRDLCETLRIPFCHGRQGFEWYHNAATRATQAITPRNLPRAQDIAKKVTILVPDGVGFRAPVSRRREQLWCDPGITIYNVATIDRSTGVVDKSSTVNGTDVMTYRWPRLECPMDAVANWRANLPDKVPPRKASETLLSHLRNVNDLGHRRGLETLIDTIVTADLLRNELAGTILGQALASEYPLIFALPTGSSLEDTTNQGKTNFCRVLGDALMPGIGRNVAVYTRSASAPAQRSMAQFIERWGGVIFDEFVLAKAHEHCFNQVGLQALATGSIVNPGKAMENSAGVRLSHPMLFSAKLPPAVPDLQNRMAPFFLDVITAENGASDVELAEIMSGKLGVSVRLSHLMWLQEQGVESVLRDSSVKSMAWRLTAHCGIAEVVGDLPSMMAYLKEATAHMGRQVVDADASGLSDDIGAKTGFHSRWYFDSAADTTLSSLVMQTKTNKMQTTTALREIIEDGEVRRYSGVLKEYGISEKGAVQKFVAELKEGPWVRDSRWVLEYHQNKLPNGRPRSWVVFRDLVAEERDAAIGMPDVDQNN